MKKSFLLKLLLFFAFFSNIMAQTDTNGDSIKSSMYLNGGSILVYNTLSVNYNLNIHQSENGFFKNYYVNLEAGIFNRNSGFTSGTNADGVLGGLGLIGLTGRGIEHFEVGLGILINADTNINNEDPFENNQKQVFALPEVTLGYRIQKKNGILFRAGISFPKGIYLGLGYSF